MDLFSCLHLKTSSDYLLRSSSGYGEVMVASFSWKHREHIFVMLEICFRISWDLSCWSSCYVFSIFYFLYVTQKSSAFAIIFNSRMLKMIILPLLFKLYFSQSKIYFLRVRDCCYTFAYHAFVSRVTSERPTLQLQSRVSCVSFWTIFFVTSFDYLWHVLSTSIGYFNRIFNKEFL